LKANESQWIERHGFVAVGIALCGFGARLWAAWGIFLNPDEALHFRLANQSSLLQAYRASLTASHPPLLTLVLYFWRVFGTSELWLRMPSILASVVFCWMFYKWLSRAAGWTAGLIGLCFVSLLPPVVLLSTEIRQYALLLAFLSSALFFLDGAFSEKSVKGMVAFSLCLYLAILSHYSAFLFAAALGFYALLRIVQDRPPIGVVVGWAAGQVGALALAIFLYKTHISKLGVGESRTALQGWMSEFFLRRSYFDRAHDNPITFLVGHTFGVFQYFFGQLVVGDVMTLFFLVGIVLLIRGRAQAKSGEQAGRESVAFSQRLGILLLLPFAVAATASLAHAYPYGGTRHISFLIIPGVAGVSVAITCLVGKRLMRGLALVVVVLIACVAFGKPRSPKMERSDQSIAHMNDAMAFIRREVAPADLIFTDYETELILAHYLCRQQPVILEASPATFEQFSCGGHRVVSRDYKAWKFMGSDFPEEWLSFVQAYGLRPGQTVWIVQTGWEVNLPQDLRKNHAEFRDLPFEPFGANILIFKMTVGQHMPVAHE
jgi:hypothetical protein